MKLTITQLKAFFRTVIKVVASGPAVGTPGSNRAAGVLAALDTLAEFAERLPTDALALTAAQALLTGSNVAANVLCALTGDWNATGTNTTVYVLGLRADAFASTGWVVDSTGGVRAVAVDVVAGTWQEATLDTSDLVNLSDDQEVDGVKAWLKHLLINTLASPVYQGADPVMLVQSEGLRWARANKPGQAVAQLAYNFNDDILDLSAGQVTVPAPTNGDNAARKDSVDAVATGLLLRPTRTANDTLTADDLGAVAPVNASGPVTLTVPTGLGLAAPSGATSGAAKVCYPLQTGPGLLTLAAAPGVNLRTPPGAGLKSPGQDARLVLIWLDTNTVLVEGGVV